MSPETIYVAPLSLVETTVTDANVSHLVTLINGETLISTPTGIGPDRHLRLAMNDICEPQPGLVLPCETHVADLIGAEGEGVHELLDRVVHGPGQPPR